MWIEYNNELINLDNVKLIYKSKLGYDLIFLSSLGSDTHEFKFRREVERDTAYMNIVYGLTNESSFIDLNK